MAKKPAKAKKRAKAKKPAKASKQARAKKPAKKGRLIMKAVVASPSSVDSDVRKAVRSVTHYTSSTDVINTLYQALGAWYDAADEIEKLLVVTYGYSTFRLNDPEAKSHHGKTFNAFIIYCRKKILGA